MIKNTMIHHVNWGDTDMAGISYYPNYFRWFDTNTLQMLHKNGLPPKELMVEKNMSFPLIDAGCTCFKPLYYNDEIKVISQIVEINRKTFKVKHEVFRGEELTGEGFEVRGWVSFKEGKLKAEMIPDEVGAKLRGENTVEVIL